MSIRSWNTSLVVSYEDPRKRNPCDQTLGNGLGGDLEVWSRRGRQQTLRDVSFLEGSGIENSEVLPSSRRPGVLSVSDPRGLTRTRGLRSPLKPPSISGLRSRSGPHSSLSLYPWSHPPLLLRGRSPRSRPSSYEGRKSTLYLPSVENWTGVSKVNKPYQKIRGKGIKFK